MLLLKRLPRGRGRWSSWIIIALLVVLGTYGSMTPTGAAMDRALAPLRFGAVSRAASGKIVVVEMDAQSASAIKQWPWSRAHYGAVVDQLRAAGSTAIVFDVDFSSASDRPGDNAFAAALKRANGAVILPTFGQVASATDRRSIDALPIPLFRPDVSLASVNVAPDADGLVRSMPMGTVTDRLPRPSLAAYMAQRSGEAGQEFPIDMSIDPGTIPRLSFIDVRNGKFDPSAVRGRTVLIGATAIEMGDRYGVPQWGVLPGVVVQAMAGETLLRGIPANGFFLLPLMIAVACVILIISRRSVVQLAATTLVSLTIVVGFTLVAQHIFLVYFPMATALLVIGLGGLICAARAVIDRFERLSMIDEATGLPNAKALVQSMRNAPSATLAVFQIENYDSLGAVLGGSAIDEVVRRISDRLAFSANCGTVYRTTDRQLAIDMPTNEPLKTIFEGLRLLLLQPVEVIGRRVDVSVCAGVATGNAPTERLLSDATLAADTAFKSGAFWCDTGADLENLELSVSLMGELDDALESGQIEVFYQPKLDLRKSRIASVEALVRWRHPQRGFIGPDTFIPLAEKTNRIAPLTMFVLRRVLSDLVKFRSIQEGFSAAINISANLLSSPSFNAGVEGLIMSSDLPATSLIFEVTESAALSDPASAIAALRHYRGLGLGVSIDDYGTGQSTLTYLRKLPLNEIKIDRSFIQHAHVNENDAVLVRSTIELGHKLGLKVVAEGVEDAACLAFLQTSGCDMVQGYFVSKPVSFEQLCALIVDPASMAA